MSRVEAALALYGNVLSGELSKERYDKAVANLIKLLTLMSDNEHDHFEKRLKEKRDERAQST